MKNITPKLVSNLSFVIAATLTSASASAVLPATHLVNLRQDVKTSKPLGAKSKAKRKTAQAVQAVPRMVAKDDLQGDAQPLEDQLEIEAMNEADDVQLGEATNGTLAMQNGIKANSQISFVQTILKGWQPASVPNLPTVTTSGKK